MTLIIIVTFLHSEIVCAFIFQPSSQLIFHKLVIKKLTVKSVFKYTRKTKTNIQHQLSYLLKL